jgi:S-layer homology domain
VPCKRPAVFLSLAVLLTSLTACANSPVAKNLEQSLAADPKLKDNPAIFGEAKNKVSPTESPQGTVQLPDGFPKDIPLYPNANLQEATPVSGSQGSVSTRWQSYDPSNLIESFYRQQFQTNNWQISPQSAEQSGVLEAHRNNLQVKVAIQPKSVTNATPNQPQTATELLIEYAPNATATAQPSPTTTPAETANAQVSNTQSNNGTSQPGNLDFIGPVLPSNSPAQPSATPDANNATVATASGSQEFSDLNKVPPELRRYIQDLATLSVLPIQSNANKSNSPTTKLFEPGKIITRREYARWLFAANNAMYSNNPAKQIRLASESSQASFSDLPKTNPDFPVIQGLAEAGLIPSLLSGDSTEVLFRPDAPLTREQLILWKLPLDTRQALPAANLEAVKQTWGFQDVGKIDPKALRAVLADFQNGEQSNIRRVFGYTTLFQPKKTVTRAEAAAALWYFGTQGDGISATDALKLKRSPN